MNRSSILLLAGLLLVLAGGALTWRSLGRGPAPAGEVPRVAELGDKKLLPTFALRGPRGEFTQANLRGRWSFVFFGYTQCPDICPTALALMKEVRAAVAPAPTPQVVFVSVDPRRDTPSLLAQYMAAFDPSFLAITGDDAELAPLVGALGVYFKRNDGTDTQRYTVDHSASIHLVDPQGLLVAVFEPPHDGLRMAADYRRIVR